MSDATVQNRTASINGIQTEIIRKSIHMLVAFVPAFARINLTLTFAGLVLGLLVYSYSEYTRLSLGYVNLISRITSAASRGRDSGFVFGPVTLALGSLMALTLYPEPAAAVAIYALAFGDGFASLFGKLFGRKIIPFTGGKTYAGSLACLVSVFLSTLAVSGSVRTSIIVSFTVTFIEALPSGDLDNMLLPMAAGLAAVILL